MATQPLLVKYSSLNDISVLNHFTAGEFVAGGGRGVLHKNIPSGPFKKPE